MNCSASASNLGHMGDKEEEAGGQGVRKHGYTRLLPSTVYTRETDE